MPLTLRIATDEHAYGDLSITAGDEATTRNLIILACENEMMSPYRGHRFYALYRRGRSNSGDSVPCHS
jgi:hypothetical protein